jgi:hypothetical protein
MRNHKRICIHDHEEVMESDADDYEEVLYDVDHNNHRSSLNDIAEEPMDASAVPVVVSLVDDWQQLTQFLQHGRCVCSEGDLQLVKFISMAHRGYGVSRSYSEGMLDYAKESGGSNVHLPDSWRACVELTSSLIEKMQGKRKTFTLDVPIPENVRVLLADPKQTHIGFEFECPITEMVRIAMFSETCQNWDNVALSYEENDGFLDDFCNGDRYKRIAADISPSGAILGAVLATDGICLDKCMFDSQEVHYAWIEDWLVYWIDKLDWGLDYRLDYRLDYILDLILDSLLDSLLACCPIANTLHPLAPPLRLRLGRYLARSSEDTLGNATRS